MTSEPFYFQRTIMVEEIDNPWDIVASGNVLYVSEKSTRLIHRIQLPDESVSNWSVDGYRLTLSISKNGNVIVASWDSNNILEYTSDGTLVRQIAVNRIDRNHVGLQHAIQLEGDKFLVSQDTETNNRVCMIDNTGKVIKCYGERFGPGMGYFNLQIESADLTIGRNGSILVADAHDNRIVQLKRVAGIYE